MCVVVSFSHRTFHSESLYPSAYLKTSTAMATAAKVRFLIIIQCDIPGIDTFPILWGIEQIFEWNLNEKRALSCSTPFEKYKHIFVHLDTRLTEIINFKILALCVQQLWTRRNHQLSCWFNNNMKSCCTIFPEFLKIQEQLTI